MKKLLISLVVISFVCAGAAQAITVENFSFELPNAGKQTCWDGEQAESTDVPGWTDGDYAAADAGVEETLDSGWLGVTGDWRAFINSADGPVWNMTDYEIATGDVFTLKVDTGATGSPGRQVTMELFYDNEGTHVTLGTPVTYTLPMNKTLAEYTLADVAVTSESLGYPIGIKFASSAYIAMDNVRLDVVPEPATMALLGLGSLALLKRRRA